MNPRPILRGPSPAEPRGSSRRERLWDAETALLPPDWYGRQPGFPARRWRGDAGATARGLSRSWTGPVSPPRSLRPATLGRCRSPVAIGQHRFATPSWQAPNLALRSARSADQGVACGIRRSRIDLRPEGGAQRRRLAGQPPRFGHCGTWAAADAGQQGPRLRLPPRRPPAITVINAACRTRSSVDGDAVSVLGPRREHQRHPASTP